MAAPLAALALAACGSAGHAGSTTAGGWPAEHPVCLRVSLAAIARSLAVPVASISRSISTGNDAMPQCLYTAHRVGTRTIKVLANIDSTQGAYFVVERTIDEAAQTFTYPQRGSPPPVSVHLGLLASWFPEEQWLISTDGRKVMTVSVDWSGASQQRKIALARAVTAPYLHTPHGKLAQRLAQTFP